jgi:Zn-dependent protease with chaperone function
MTNEQYAALVARLEGMARGKPLRYRARVLFLAVLGNAYFMVILILLASAMVSLALAITTAKVVAIKALIFIAPVFWVTLKSLHVKVNPPEGVPVGQRQAPELFAMLEELQNELKAPRCTQVLISDEVNACVAQVPRFGLFGGFRNYLVLGLPLLQALTANQLRAVLAHEFAHLAGGHTHFSRWIYNQRRRWGQLMEGLDQHDRRGGFLFRPFLKWYIPTFNAYSFPLARADEFQADAVAARITGASVVAETLTGIRAASHFVHEKYWPGIHEQVQAMPQPGFMPYSELPAKLDSGLDADSAQAWIDRDMAVATGIEDTHPALSDRLAAIGESPRLSRPAPGTSADALLGPLRDDIAKRFDRNWQDRVRSAWEQRHQEIQVDRQRLATLVERQDSGETLTLQEAYDLALLNELVANDADKALAQLQTLHVTAPQDPTIMLTLAIRLLRRDDEEAGYALLEQAVETDERLMARNYEIRRDHCWRKGQVDEARGWQSKYVARMEMESRADTERNKLFLRDTFERLHGLSDEDLQMLKQDLAAIEGVKAAYIARKHVQHYPDRPCYVLGYSVTSFFQLHSKAHADEVLKKIRENVRFPGETLIICVNGANRRFGKKLRRVSDSRLV